VVLLSSNILVRMGFSGTTLLPNVLRAGSIIEMLVVLIFHCLLKHSRRFLILSLPLSTSSGKDSVSTSEDEKAAAALQKISHKAKGIPAAGVTPSSQLQGHVGVQ